MATPLDPLPPDLQRDLDFAIEAVRQASTRALGVRSSGRWEGESLADMGDQVCDAFLQGLIAGRYPEDGVLSEETVDTPDRLRKSRVWIVDPLDGTREFGAGRHDWAVHVGLVVDGRCRVGAVALPAQGQILWGVADESHRTQGWEGRPAQSTARHTHLRMAVSRSHTPPWVEALAADLDAQLVRAGSVGNKVAMLLAGEADFYVHKTGLKEWDTCAPECIALAADWAVSRLDGSRQVYNQADPRNDQVLVCRQADQARILEALVRCGVVGDPAH
ncbi:MAG: 3'(2'),5'-bisphosphate nucleotidase CysQ [Planctomycetes bacterium]|nr:3'(2'),5'-bisphosphate nucleotidase CysQ [Planctomycetota bacterium]